MPAAPPASGSWSSCACRSSPPIVAGQTRFNRSCTAPATRQCARTGERRRLAEVGFEAEQLVVLGNPIAARWRPGLDLPAVRRHGKVGDRRVLGLPAAV